ncbi:MAG TPA: lipopolysaccharide kinase InaA family protein [Candidatus Binataceae bacterium]|nr:lipopolysaccharide kinase InaA family protein [Candidatus Binataceae bacterium]
MRILYAAAPEWERLSERIASLIEDAGFESRKMTTRVRAGFLSHEGREVFVKRVAAGGSFKGILARVFGSRGWRAWRGAEFLAAARIAHPRPLLIAEERRAGAIRASYIATEPLRAARVFSQFALGRSRSAAFRRTLSKQVAGEVRRLHDAGIYTRDLQETNLMLEERDGELIVWFVDFEDFRRARQVSPERRMLNLVHLDRSIGRFASRAKRLRFFYDYFGGRPARAEARRLLREYFVLRARVGGRARRKLPTQASPAVQRSAAARGN